MILHADDRDTMLTGGPRHLCRRLGAGRRDAGLGSPRAPGYSYFYGLSIGLEVLLLAFILRCAWTWPRS